MFSNIRSVLSQCTTRLLLLHLLYDIEIIWRKTIRHAFAMFYTLIKHVNQSGRRVISSGGSVGDGPGSPLVLGKKN